jgi:hypothetical protein
MEVASNCTSLGTELSVKRILQMLNQFLSIILKGKFFRVTLKWCRRSNLSLFPVDQVPCLCKDGSIWVGVLPAEMGVFHQQQVGSCM